MEQEYFSNFSNEKSATIIDSLDTEEDVAIENFANNCIKSSDKMINFHFPTESRVKIENEKNELHSLEQQTLNLKSSTVISKNVSSIQHLNYDVLDEILTFLPAKSLASLSVTSSLMKFLVNTKVSRFLALNYVERTLRSLYPKSMFMNDLHFLSYVENGFCSPTLSCGFKHSAIVSKLGCVYTWGSNLDGELGHGDYRNRKAPTRIDSISNAASVSCGRAHTNVLTKDGKVFCFGENKPTPTLIDGELSGKIITNVSSGIDMSAFVTSEDELYVSGHGIVLEIFDHQDDEDDITSSVSDLFTPRKVKLGELSNSTELSSSTTSPKEGSNEPCRKFRIIQIACGGRHLVILTNKGEVYTCGFGGMGQLGHGNTDDKLTPTKIASLNGKTIVFISAGQYHTAVVTSTGELYTFGYNSNNCLGLKKQNEQDDLEIVTSPRLVDLDDHVVMVATGNSQTLVLTSSNEILTFGSVVSALNQEHNICASSFFPALAQARDSENPYKGIRGKLSKQGRFVQIAAGGEHSCALTDHGDIILSNQNILERASLITQSRRISTIDEQQLNKHKMDHNLSNSTTTTIPAKISKKRLTFTPISNSTLSSSQLSPSGINSINTSNKRAKYIHAT